MKMAKMLELKKEYGLTDEFTEKDDMDSIPKLNKE